MTDYLQNTRVMVRNFYGVVRTRDYASPVPFRAMYHGGINHGGQLLDAALRSRPTSYFAPSSGYGRVFASLPDAPRRVGVIGLGAGALAAYARPGDLFRFYEIDPQVAAVAVSEFTYLRDSPAQIGHRPGRRPAVARARGRRRTTTCSRSTPSRGIRSRCT